jgi:hypothetical protein
MTSVRTQVSGQGPGQPGPDVARDRFARAGGQGRDVRRNGERDGNLGSTAELGRGGADLSERAGQFEQALAQGGRPMTDAKGGGQDRLGARQESDQREAELVAALALAVRTTASAAPTAAAPPPAALAPPDLEPIAERIAQAAREALHLSHGEPVSLRVPIDADGPLAAIQVVLTARSVEVSLLPGALLQPDTVSLAVRELRDRLAHRFPNRRVSVEGAEPAPAEAAYGLAAIGRLLAAGHGGSAS